MTKQIVTVLGGTGKQGGGVVDALLGARQVRGARCQSKSRRRHGRALAARRVEVVKADLLDPSSLRSALKGSHGAFVVTNAWDPAQGPREAEIATAAVKAARAAGVEHLIWSTLPDVETLTGGRLKVAHFTEKARVDAVVKAAGFARHTFVMAPMYFQNFLTTMTPSLYRTAAAAGRCRSIPPRAVIHAERCLRRRPRRRGCIRGSLPATNCPTAATSACAVAFIPSMTLSAL